MNKIDMRKLELSVNFDRIVYQPQSFVDEYKLHKEFEKEFGCKVENWDYDIPDDEVYEELLKYLHTETKRYFVKWNEDIEENEIYYIEYIGGC